MTDHQTPVCDAHVAQPATATESGEPSAAEPFYVRQTADLMTVEEGRRWFHQAADEAISEGATWARFTEHPDMPGLLLVECWRTRPDDEGEPRWSLTRSQAGTTGVHVEVPGRDQ